MVTAFVLLNVQRSRINEAAEQLAGIDGISEVYSVSGRLDLIAVIRVASNDALADLVTSHLLKVEGIERSETLTAFRVHSRHDLDTMFSIGMA